MGREEGPAERYVCTSNDENEEQGTGNISTTIRERVSERVTEGKIIRRMCVREAGMVAGMIDVGVYLLVVV